jgi:3-deoxy-manno-octulosonate cytidylyltransferase (CMP-KDO synthetase)
VTVPPGQCVCVIPARMASTRFPGKVLANRTGKPLVQHVVEAARRAASVARVVVATDDQRVRAALEPFGTETVMTSPEHPNGTSRLAEAARLLGLTDEAIVVNAQGDEPELEPSTIDAAVESLHRTGATIGTAARVYAPGEDVRDPSGVKVVLRLDGTALYFSRSPIPFDRDGAGGTDARVLRHVGLYVYRRAFLETFLKLEPTPLERCEQLEQLRALQHGYLIAVATVERGAAGVDTPEQYEAFVRRWMQR